PAKAGSVMTRPVTFLGDASKRNRLVSLLQPVRVPITVDTAAGKITRKFSFWFKDVLFDGDAGKLDGSEAEIAFDIWDDPAKLVGGGFEWRFAPDDEPEAEVTMRHGRDELPFFGFRLEPLRLIGLALKDSKVLS